ncbi:MAG: two-component regulator propeller domain-containing protein [Planctomycetota bacterium]
MSQHPIAAFSFFLVLACSTGCSQSLPESEAAGAGASAGGSAIGRTVDKLDARIWSILQAKSGDLWFGSNGSGAYRFDGKSVTHYGVEDGLAGGQVRGLYEHGDGGEILIATTKGVSRLDGERLAALAWDPEPTPLADYTFDPQDLWLIYGPSAVRSLATAPVRYDGHKLHHMQLPPNPAKGIQAAQQSPPFSWDPGDIYSVYRDRRGHLWFGTAGAGLCRYDGKEVAWMYEEHLTTTPSGGAFGIRSIFEDRAGDFWICNTRHRYRFEPVSQKQETGPATLRFEPKRGVPEAAADEDENFVFFPAIVEDAAGTLWMAAGGNGVVSYRDEEVAFYPLVSGAYAICICRDAGGRLLVGTLEHGVFVHDEGSVGFEAFSLSAGR